MVKIISKFWIVLILAISLGCGGRGIYVPDLPYPQIIPRPHLHLTEDIELKCYRMPYEDGVAILDHWDKQDGEIKKGQAGMKAYRDYIKNR